MRRTGQDHPVTGPTASQGGLLRPGFDSMRDELFDLAHSGKRWIAQISFSSPRSRARSSGC